MIDPGMSELRIIIRVSTIIEKRLLQYKNGKFYFIVDNETVPDVLFDDEGKPVRIEEGRLSRFDIKDVDGINGDLKRGDSMAISGSRLIDYVVNTIRELKDKDNSDELFLLNILDQKVFSVNNFKSTYEKNVARGINDLVRDLKIHLKNRMLNKPEEVVDLIKKNRMKYPNNRFEAYLLNLFEEGVLNYDVMKESGFFDELSSQKLKTLMKERLLNSKQIINLQIKGVISREDAIECLGGIDNIVTLYRRAERNRNPRDSKLYLELIGQLNGLILYGAGKLSLQDINKLNITKEMIEFQSEQDFVNIIFRGLPDGVEFTSEELISEYITKLSGDSLVKLAKKGIVKPEELIDILDIEVDRSEEDRKLKAEDLIELYNPDFIASKLLEDEIDFDFINKVNSKVLSTLDDEQRKEYWKKAVERIKKTTNRQQFHAIMIAMSENTEVPKQVLKDIVIPAKDIESLYYDGKVTDDDIIEYYNAGMVDDESIKILFGQDFNQMIEMINTGKLSARAFSTIPVEILSDKVINGEVELKELYKAYMDIDALDIESLKQIVEDYDTDYYLRKEFGEDVGERIRIADFIDENVDIQKLRELYIADILSHGDILELKDKNILTEEQAEEISKIDRERLFNDLFKKRIISESDGKKGPGGPGDPTKDDKETKKHTIRIENSSKRNFFEGIGNCIIKKLETTGSNNPFSGYTLIGYPDYGLVILEDLESDRNNATYIMTIEEFNGFIKSNNNNSIVFGKGKQALKEECARGKAVKSRNHSALWGKNVIDTMREFSKDARQEITGDIQIQYSEMMIDEYHRKDMEKASGDDERLERLRAEIEFEKSNTRRAIRKNELREVKRQKSKAKQKNGKEDPNHGEE